MYSSLNSSRCRQSQESVWLNTFFVLFCLLIYDRMDRHDRVSLFASMYGKYSRKFEYFVVHEREAEMTSV